MEDQATHCILLDRDGVINRDLPGSVCYRNDFELLPDVANAVAEANDKGYRVLVITNQACVGRGNLDFSELDAIHRKMQDEIGRSGGSIAGIYVCPHTDADDCDCRKPQPGLIEQAQRDHGFDPAVTWMVGDSVRDAEAAVRAGCRPALVRTGKSEPVESTAGIPVFDSLTHFVAELADHGNTK